MTDPTSPVDGVTLAPPGGDAAEARTTLPRRTVIAGVAVLGAGAFAGCGGDDTAGAPPQTDTGNGGAETPAADDAAGEVLAAVSDVPVGGGVIVGGVVVTQPTEGEFQGFSSTCTHQGCRVGSVSDGTISCPCHGSQYSAEDGSVTRGPATQPLPEVAVAVEGDDVVRA